jgi:hypothetical protein
MPSLGRLSYDPFESPASMKRLLADVCLAVLEGRLWPRQASVARALVRGWINVDEYASIPALEARIRALEEKQAGKQT